MHRIGDALRVWREQKSLSQKDAAAHFGVPPRTYQDYERDLKQPGAGAITAFVRAGINANWLLTGDGSMLLADLAAPRINTDALETIIEGTIVALPKAAPAAIARQAVSFYLQCIENELITPEGIGSGNMSNAA